MKLTARTVSSIKPTDKDQMISDGMNLYFRVYHTGKKVWMMREKAKGKVTVTKLGDYPALSLKQARIKASEHRGKNNISNMRVTTLVDIYYKEQILDTKYKRPEQTKSYFDNIKSEFGNMKVSDVTRAELVNSIKGYSLRGGRAADRYRSYLKLIFNYAADSGYITTDPMQGVSCIHTGYEYTPRDRTLNDDEIKIFWQWESVVAPILRFQLLTGLRISEALNGRVDGDFFRIDNSKNGLPHWVYITDLAREQLPIHKCTDSNVRVLMLRWLKKTDIKHFTSHDLRRTFATKANSIGVNSAIVERCLNHKLQGIQAVYNHHEYEPDRIACAKAVSNYISDIVTPHET